MTFARNMASRAAMDTVKLSRLILLIVAAAEIGAFSHHAARLTTATKAPVTTFACHHSMIVMANVTITKMMFKTAGLAVGPAPCQPMGLRPVLTAFVGSLAAVHTLLVVTNASAFSRTQIIAGLVERYALQAALTPSLLALKVHCIKGLVQHFLKNYKITQLASQYVQLPVKLLTIGSCIYNPKIINI